MIFFLASMYLMMMMFSIVASVTPVPTSDGGGLHLQGLLATPREIDMIPIYGDQELTGSSFTTTSTFTSSKV